MHGLLRVHLPREVYHRGMYPCQCLLCRSGGFGVSFLVSHVERAKIIVDVYFPYWCRRRDVIILRPGGVECREIDDEAGFYRLRVM